MFALSGATAARSVSTLRAEVGLICTFLLIVELEYSFAAWRPWVVQLCYQKNPQAYGIAKVLNVDRKTAPLASVAWHCAGWLNRLAEGADWTVTATS